MILRVLSKFLFWFITLCAVGVIVLKFGFPGTWDSLMAWQASEQKNGQIFAPGPLSRLTQERGADLFPEEIVKYTNQERERVGLVPFARNTLLDNAAKIKLNDMFAQNYFEHVSPDGKGPGDVIDAAGYAYIIVGENLAMGFFSSNQDLVTAWMESPGHRANILHDRFTEIGVAAGEGNYNGKKVWLAVQEFGRPLSLCPQLDGALKAEIERDRQVISSRAKELEVRKKQLSSGAATQSEVDAYNRDVRSYNLLLTEVQGKLRIYNQQVGAFNNCISNE